MPDEVAPTPSPGEPDERPAVAVFDIDGVLADVRHRLHHVDKRPKDWPAFFAAMGDDEPLEVGVALARDLAAQGNAIVYLTGRHEGYRRLTEEWLRGHGLPEGRLVMRRDDDRRPARQLKPQELRRIARRARVVAVVDDDDAVVAVLRRDGWPVHHATWMTTRADEQQALFDAQEVDGRS
jgi:phosphoglycolate phosphatase-like HAD superfamily hydrolase